MEIPLGVVWARAYARFMRGSHGSGTEDDDQSPRNLPRWRASNIACVVIAAPDGAIA